MTAPLAPMEALLAAELPDGERLAVRAQMGWLSLPGFQGWSRAVSCSLIRAAPDSLFSREVVAALKRSAEPALRADGELVIPVGERVFV